ncbi:MAG: flavin reductase family protein [Chloroflexi bacterium]|nr:flavin reductase family protein [Chloroflexota bacterium]
MTANQGLPEPGAGAPAKKELDPVEQAMHELPYGVYIVGSVEDGQPNGMIADWVMQVSFEPRLVAVAFEANSRSLGRIRGNRAFTINLLTEDQDGLELARHFLQPFDASKIRGRSAEAQAQRYHKLDDVEHSVRPSGCPILADALAWLECEAEQFLEVGDHVLVVGRVLDGAVLASGDPLTSVYTGWIYSG